MNADTYSQLVTLLTKTDGRDKLYKIIAGLLRYYAYVLTFARSSTKKEAAKRFISLSNTISQGRSVMRLGKWLENLKKLKDLAPSMSMETDKTSHTSFVQSVDAFLDAVRLSFDFGYVVGDNVALVRKHGIGASLLPTTAAILVRARILQFWAFTYAVLLDLLRLYNHVRAHSSAPGERVKRRDLTLNLVKNACDFLILFDVTGYGAAIFRPSAGTSAILTTFSGCIATYQNFQKIAPAVPKLMPCVVVPGKTEPEQLSRKKDLKSSTEEVQQ